VLRALSERRARDWRALAASRLFAEATAEGRLVATEAVAVGDDLQLLRTERPAAVLRHERIPFVSYPYEWTPGMLHDAARLQLDLLLAALDEDLTLRTRRLTTCSSAGRCPSSSTSGPSSRSATASRGWATARSSWRPTRRSADAQPEPRPTSPKAYTSSQPTSGKTSTKKLVAAAAARYRADS